MGYILISLTDKNDAATIDSDLLAHRLRDKREPTAFYSERDPEQACITKQAEEAGSVGVLFGHNGKGSLRATTDTESIWADGPALGRLFRKGRIYVFACNTLGSEVSDPLGQQAVEAGVRVFVGHSASISTPDSRFADRPEYEEIQNCFLAMVQTFLDGSDDKTAIQESGWESYNALEEGIGTDERDFEFWPVSVSIQRLITSLNVLKRTGE